MANRRYIDFPIAASVGNNDIVLIWQDGLNKQTTKETLLQGSPQSLAGLTDVDISALNNGQILQYNSTTSKWENVDRTDINLSELGDVTIVAPSNGQVLVYNSSTGKWENSSGGYVPYTGAVTTVNLGAQTIQAGSFVKAGGTSAQFLKADGSVDSSTYGTGTVTSVALTMPSAFSVGGSPITTAGTLAVTGAGTVGQYIRGDGSLADFPATTGGGSSVSYYLNGSVSQGTIGGVAYREVNRTPIFGAGTDITRNSDGYIASFITDAGDPNKLLIPAGNWNLETYFSASSGGGSPTFYVELYKYNGTTFTLIATSSATPELIAFGTNINPYFSTLAVPETVLTLTDRLALRYYVNTSGRTITLHTEDNHLCQVITTFTTGLTALNGLTSQVQYLTVGTSGTDFNIASSVDTHTFNLPTASATNRGALSSADWTTFNNKTSNLGTVTSVGLSSATSGVTIGSTPITTSGTITLAIATASGSQNGLLSSTDWTTFNGKQNALTNPVTGTGTSGRVAFWNGTNSITSDADLLFDGSNLTVGGNITLANGANRFVRIGSVNNYNYDLQTTGDDFQIIEAGGSLATPRLTIKFPNGNVGINTTTPATAFEVNGVGLFSGTSLVGNTKNGLYIYDQAIISLGGTAARPLQIQSQTLSIHTGTTYSEKIKVFENGNVVINTSPTDNGAKLQITKGQDISLSLRSGASGDFTYAAIGRTSDEFAIGVAGAANQFFTGSLAGDATIKALGTNNRILLGYGNGVPAITISSANNVIIGSTTDAGQRLQIITTGASNYLRIQTENNASYDCANFFTDGVNSVYAGMMRATSGLTGAFSIYTGGNIRFNVTSGGSVGINNSIPMNSNWGNDTSTKQLSIDASSYAVINLQGSTRKYSMGVGDGNFYMCYDNTANRHNIVVSSGGNVLIGTTTAGSSKLRIVGLPTSAAGLSSGDVYNLSGVLMIA